MNTLVMKFGGAAVATPEHFSRIAEIIIDRGKKYSRLVAVVSAMGKTTDQLIELAKQVHPNPPQREYDMLISVGERISMSLLAMALCLKNREAMSFTGSQSGIITCSNHTNASIVDVRPFRLSEALNQGKIVIVAGFQGVSVQKEITTLGRGGSDTTAVALGVALGADHVEFFKDVDGIYNADPKLHCDAERFSKITYDTALDIAKKGAKVMHHRAIRLARKNGIGLHICSFSRSDQKSEGTWIEEPNKKRREKPVYEQESDGACNDD